MKFTCITFLMFLLLSVTVGFSAGVCGDVNGDGEVNVGDPVWLINFIFNGGSPPICTRSLIEVDSVIDIDGNVYQTVKIGEQWWMAENLKTTTYRDGTPIPLITDSSAWSSANFGAYANYDNDTINVEYFGRLYNWMAVDDPAGIAPEGWHVPTDEEWKELEMFLGLTQTEVDIADWRGTTEGGLLKLVGNTLWGIDSSNTGATNEYGFTAFPAGYRGNGAGQFHREQLSARFWTSTSESGAPNGAWSRSLAYDYGQILRLAATRQNGFSIRCVKD